MLKTDKLELDGVTYESTQFPAMRGFKLLARLIKQVGPAMAALAGSGDPTTQTVSLENLAPALGGGLAALDPDEAGRLILELLASTTALVQDDKTGPRQVSFLGKDAQASFDAVFSGRLGDMLKVVGMVLKLNFELFSGGGASAPATPPAA